MIFVISFYVVSLLSLKSFVVHVLFRLPRLMFIFLMLDPLTPDLMSPPLVHSELNSPPSLSLPQFIDLHAAPHGMLGHGEVRSWTL